MEEVAKVASDTVDALKQQPVLLALVVLQLVLLGTVTWASTQNKRAEAARFHEVMQLCGPRTTE